MTLTHILSKIKSIYNDPRLSNDARYLFSYRNLEGDYIELFRDFIRIFLDGKITQIELSQVQVVSLNVPNPKDHTSCSIMLSGGFGDIHILVNTLTGGQFFDVFPIQKALERQVFLAKS